ncbi:hypothetical protein [Acinetobacter radioresistens]|uniref:Uncharacterized protein n=1 Tax=Acinetobacter radioresistens TaxID=40216 RepID=A0A8H2K310_ACIRA|nr:hypothetical protein [Acinetobacter radioresistens]TNX93648.1 hypothetical protein FHY67_04210 [Acinetobacter radioresistens]
MDFGYFIGQLFIISCIPLIYYALTKNLNLRDIKKVRWQFIVAFIFISLLAFIGSNGRGESFFAIIISLFTYIFTYKRLIKNKYQPKIVDFESFDEYVAALAKKRNIKYPLSQNIINMHGSIPKLEDFNSIPDWSKAVKRYLDDLDSI